MTINPDRFVAEGGIKQLQERVKGARAAHPDDAHLEQLAREVEALREDLTGGDWSRIGVILGLLWAKFDTIIKHLADISGNTGRTASAHR